MNRDYSRSCLPINAWLLIVLAAQAKMNGRSASFSQCEQIMSDRKPSSCINQCV